MRRKMISPYTMFLRTLNPRKSGKSSHVRELSKLAEAQKDHLDSHFRNHVGHSLHLGWKKIIDTHTLHICVCIYFYIYYFYILYLYKHILNL